jgi:hypothetical protein
MSGLQTEIVYPQITHLAGREDHTYMGLCEREQVVKALRAMA